MNKLLLLFAFIPMLLSAQQDSIILTDRQEFLLKLTYPPIELTEPTGELYLEVEQQFILPFCLVEIERKVMYDMTERKFKQCISGQWIDITVKED